MTPALTHLVPLAEELDKNKVTPGVLGFVVFAILGAAVWMLMRNMNKQLNKIDFQEPPETGREPAGSPSGAPDTAGSGAPKAGDGSTSAG